VRPISPFWAHFPPPWGPPLPRASRAHLALSVRARKATKPEGERGGKGENWQKKAEKPEEFACKVEFSSEESLETTLETPPSFA